MNLISNAPSKQEKYQELINKFIKKSNEGNNGGQNDPCLCNQENVLSLF